MLASSIHQSTNLVVVEKGRGTTTPVQLLHDTRAIKQRPLHLKLFGDPIQIRGGLGPILGRNLVATTIEADRVTEWDMEIERERTQRIFLIGTFHHFLVLLRAKPFMELYRSRIRGVTRPRLVVTTDQIHIKGEYLFH